MGRYMMGPTNGGPIAPPTLPTRDFLVLKGYSTAHRRGGDLSGMTEAPSILIADDSQLVRRLVARTLQARGYRVITVEDGLAAIESAWRELPDLVLLDVDMPRMNGYQVARLLRHEPRTARIPIVILSSHETAGDIFWGLEAGADAYLTKSSGETAILETISRVLSERGAGEPDAPTPSSGQPGAQLDVLARLNDLLDQKLYEATVLNQIGQLAAELQDYRRAAERAGALLARVLDYQAVGLLFLRADPAEGLIIVSGPSATATPAVAEHLLAVIPGEVRTDLSPPYRRASTHDGRGPRGREPPAHRPVAQLRARR
jgi:CheY-like chemotaxis protein